MTDGVFADALAVFRPTYSDSNEVKTRTDSILMVLLSHSARVG